MELQKIRGNSHEQVFRWILFFAMLLSGCILFAGQSSRFAVMVYRRYLPMLVLVLMAVCIYRGDYKLRSVYGLGLGFFGWYVVTRWLLGDCYLNPSYNYLVELSLVYGLLLPFAMLCGEGKHRMAMKIVALIYVVLTLGLSLCAIFCTLRGTAVQLLYIGRDISMNDGRLWLLGIQPDYGSALLNAGLLILICLLAGCKHKGLLVPGVLMAALIFCAASLTGSWAGLISRSAALAVVACVLMSRLPVQKRQWKIGLLVLSFIAAFAAAWLISGAISHAAGALAAPKMRAEVYRELLEGMGRNPRSFLIGCADVEVMDLLDRHQGDETLRGSFFQVLALTGVPGLVIIAALCVFLILAALKLLLDPSKPMEQRLLPAIMAALLLHGAMESTLFVPWTLMGPAAGVNFVFMLSAGYTVEMAKGLKLKELFSSAKK